MADQSGDQPMISAHQLVKRFGDFTAVDGIEVEVRRGEAFGFLGPNGAGKSWDWSAWVLAARRIERLLLR